MSLATRFAEKAASVLSAPRTSRRGFLARSAVVGSALAVDPISYVLKPGSAYAAVCTYYGSQCTCGALCGDGYTEFCCTLTGRNACPSGTLTAGWWKVDGSQFCNGASRYYMDCNTMCGSCGCGGSGVCSGSCSGTACGCANGSCNNRKSGCTMFRYGQCHQELKCVGPIKCRIVTCTPPWQVDPSCGRSVLVDNNTRNHDRPCLHREPFGALNTVVATGGPNKVRVTGWAIDPDTTDPIQVHVYLDGQGLVAVTANVPRSDVAASFPASGPNHGYDVTIDVPAGNHLVTTYAINVGEGLANTMLGSVRVDVGGSPRGTLESVDVVGPNLLRARGWAYDPDRTGAIGVAIVVDGKTVTTTPADKSRPDAEPQYPGYGPNHGFDEIFLVTAGAHDVCATALNADSGSNVSLGCRQVSVGGVPFGALEAIVPGPGTVRVSGWAIDPDTGEALTIRVLVDGAEAGRFVANEIRPDVNAAFPGWGIAHGFDGSFGVAAGRRVVCVEALDPVSGRPSTSLGCRTITVGGVPTGAVDQVTWQGGQLRVLGWAIDPDSAGPVTVLVLADGVQVGRTTADEPRPDIGATRPGYGDAHGFDATFSVASKPREVCLVALDRRAWGDVGGSKTGANRVTLGCRAPA